MKIPIWTRRSLPGSFERLHLTCAAGSDPGTSCTTSSTDLIDLYSYDDSGNRLTSYSPASGSGSHTFSYSSGSNRMDSWSRSGWTTTPSVGMSWPADGIYGTGGGPGQRLYDYRAAGDGNADVTRYFAYFPSGRNRYIEVTDARGTTRVSLQGDPACDSVSTPASRMNRSAWAQLSG